MLGLPCPPEATPGGDFSFTLAGLAQAAVGLQQHLSPVPVAPLFSVHRDGFGAQLLLPAALGSWHGFHSRQPDWRSRRMKLSLKHLRRIILSGLV